MDNPWTHLPNDAPFVLPEDDGSVRAFNKRHAGKPTEVLFDQLPSPYVGNPEAAIVLLNLNPAYALETASTPTLALFTDIAKANFEHRFFDYPFYPLAPMPWRPHQGIGNRCQGICKENILRGVFSLPLA